MEPTPDRPLTELEKDAVLSNLYAPRPQADSAGVIGGMRAQAPLQNPSNLVTFADDAHRRELFIADIGKRITINGTGHTVDYLRKAYQFSLKQARAVSDEAKRELHAKIQGDTDIMRSVIIARLESVARRAADACDLSNEIRAVKELARVLGVYTTEESGLGDLAVLLRDMSGKQGPDPKKIIDVEHYEVDDEAEASEETWTPPGKFKEFEEPKLPDGS